MPDSDPFAATPAAPGASTVGEIVVPRDDEAVRVRALVEARLLGETEPAMATVGRFLLLERLGEGGMGVVWAAYDPQLDRKVAVKLLRREQTDAAVRKRILREAQAMARLSHPNVAQVFEVGEHRGHTFIALEYVRGKTLRAWQNEASRDWREILHVYAQAGRGLVAAHDVGLVHRDFKPDNAMLGRDDRVRVLDFGLARSGEGITATDLHLDTLLPSPGEDALATPLTHDGAVMGTPAYMAPEQLLGEATDARTDQFSFCVALWEALYRERPFAGASRVELIANVTGGRLRSTPRQSKVPPWIRAVLQRGLEVGPSHRHPTMADLLAALANDPTRRRRRWIAIGATVGVLAVGGVASEGLRRHGVAQRTRACEEAGTGIDESWNDDARARVSDAISATGLSYAQTTAEKLMPRLDVATQTWRSEATEACMNRMVHGTWNEETHGRASWCLDERRLEIAAFIGELEQADADVVRSSIPAAARLMVTASCVDEASLASLPEPPEASVREAIARTRADLARANVLRVAGKPAAALEVARTVKRDAEAHAWPPLLAAANLAEARVMFETALPEDAERALTSAYVYAATTNAWDVADQAAIDLVYHVGYTSRRHAEGRSWATHAQVAATRVGDPTGLREASRTHNLAIIRYAEGEYADALALHERVLAIEEAALGPDHPMLTPTLSQIGNVHLARGDHASALPLLERVLAIDESALGPEHPEVAGVLTSLTGARLMLGDMAVAKALGERALGIYERAFGPEHAKVGLALANLAEIHARVGETDVAFELARRSLEIRRRRLAPTHPELADGLEQLGIVELMRGNEAAAREPFERALAIREQALGADHPTVARVLANLAHVRRVAGDLDGARAYWERALRIDEAKQGSTSPSLSFPMIGLARVATLQGRHADAVALATRALELREAAQMPGTHLGEAKYVLALALWDASSADGRERARAVALATAAREAYRAQQGSDAEIAEIDAWLARASQ